MGLQGRWVLISSTLQRRLKRKSKKFPEANGTADFRPLSRGLMDAHTGFSIALNSQGSIDINVGTGSRIKVLSTGLSLQQKTWSKIKVIFNGPLVKLNLTPKSFRVEPVYPASAFESQLDGESLVYGRGPLHIAATQQRVADNTQSGLRLHATDFFNSRIDSLTLKTCDKQPLILAKYDFSLGMSGDRILDISGRGYHGVLVNAPTRAVKGHDWDGSECDWTRARFGYGAIHFHDDDPDDANWETDFVITIPPNSRSGAYAVEVETSNGQDTDSITFFVRPTRWTLDNSNKNTADLGPGFDINKALKSPEFYKMRRRVDLGLSCYDRHNDGSGVCYSSSKRPILNEGIPYETLTDHDLHARGASALQGFSTVITGCHPEYPSLESFRAYDAFAKRGGNLMYMGGNGFYWNLPSGEHVNSLDGQRGGLWRSRGMSCNTLFGVGFCAQGTGLGVPYRRTEASRDPELSWMFTGVEGDLIGEFGFGGGASGDEIDRFDVGNGSPEGALVLATSTGHSDDFGIAIEDLSYPALNTLGTQTDLIRSDVVYYVGSGGGGVFSVN
ncbi:hypothetical protein CI102_7810 [Trichoderma harzianum]|nr:hypothetical protein CI102_7810 [Trichoderma harzianum]